jgi:hypothetical protein
MQVREECLLERIKDHHSSLRRLPRIGLLLPVTSMEREKVEVSQEEYYIIA